MPEALTEDDEKYLRRCLQLAKESVEAGDQPFGSVLVDEKGKIIAEAKNRVNTKDLLSHPEIELAQWSVKNISKQERKKIRMYTTGEHCPMCSGAHGLAGLGTLIYLSSAAQLMEWQKELGVTSADIHFLPAQEIIKDAEIRGPGHNELLDEIKELHKKAAQFSAKE